MKTHPYKFHGYLSRTQNRECKSNNAIIPSYVDIDFIQKNNLAEITVQKSSDSSPLPGPLADEKRGDIKDFNFFVSTKFHFGNNSWTWTNGGQINANEWYNILGRTPVYPITPIKVFLWYEGARCTCKLFRWNPWIQNCQMMNVFEKTNQNVHLGRVGTSFWLWWSLQWHSHCMGRKQLLQSEFW